MATLIQSKQIQGVVTASVIEGIFTVSGSLVATDITASGNVKANTFTGNGGGLTNINFGSIVNAPTLVSGSSQIVGILTDLNTFSGSQNTKDLTIATYTASVTSQLSNLTQATSSFETNGRGIISSSAQISALGYVVGGGGGGGTSDYTQLINVPNGIISGSSQITALGFVSSSASVPTGTISGSSQITALGFVSSSTSVPTGTISSSAQITSLGFVSSSTNISALNAFTASYFTDSASFDSKLLTALSFGGQVDVAGSTSINSGNQNFNSGSNYSFEIIDIRTIQYSIGDLINIQNTNGAVRELVGKVISFTGVGNYGCTVVLSIITDTSNHNFRTGYGNHPFILTKRNADFLSVTDFNSFGVLSGSSTDISALNAFTASINQKFDTLGSQSGSFGGGTTIPSGTISGSSQLTSSFDIRYTLSGSVQPLPSNIVSGSSQISYTGLSTIPAGIISSSQQLPQGLVSGSSQVLGGSGVISGSSQLTASYDSRYTLSGSVQNVILPSDLISSSAQITSLGFVSGSYATSQSVAELVISSSQMTASIAGLRADVNSLTTAGVPAGTISGSLQIQRAGFLLSSSFNSFTQSLATAITASGTNVTINGNLTVKGTTTTINSTTLQIGDNIIELNGSNNANAGLLVKDSLGASTISGSLLWDATNDRWIAGPKNSEEYILLAGSDGVVSGSSQISFTELNNLPSGIVSSSDQITSSLDGVFATDADLTTFSSSIATTLESLSQSSGYINYVTNSVEQLTGIEVADFDNNTAVTFTNGVLKFIFGTPTAPTSVAASLSGFATDRFNKVTDAYSVNGSWNNQGYTLVSASLYEGATLLTQVGNGTSLTYSTTTSGSHTYTLQYTASSPLDGSLYKTSTTTTGTVSKSNPAAPTLSSTPSVQLGYTSNQIEQGATGSITFTSSSANPSNSWNLTSVTTNVASPYYVTGSATGSTSISITATANYASPSGDNSPDLTTTSTTTNTYSKIRSLRHGASAATSFTAGELETLALWDTTLGGAIGTIVKGTTTASGQSVTISWSGDKFHYIVFNSSLSNLSNITTSGFGVLGSFAVTTVGQYKVYKTTTLQAGGAGSSITYILT